MAALVISSFWGQKVFKIDGIHNPRMWCFGYDMDNMKARCWYDQTMPLILLPESKRLSYIEIIQLLISAAEDVIKLLQDQIKAAWFERPKDAKGDMSFVQASFYEQTEASFFTIGEQILMRLKMIWIQHRYSQTGKILSSKQLKNSLMNMHCRIQMNKKI